MNKTMFGGIALGSALVLATMAAGGMANAQKFSPDYLAGDWSADNPRMWDLRFKPGGQVEEIEVAAEPSTEKKLKGRYSFVSEKEILLTFKDGEEVIEVGCEVEGLVLLCGTDGYLYEYRKK